MESNSVSKPSGFRETVFTTCSDNFVRPEKPIIRRNIAAIEQNFGSPLTVQMSQPISEFLPFNPKIQKIRNVNMSTRRDELASNIKAKGECFLDIYKESKQYELADKPNKVKIIGGKRFNDETVNRNPIFDPPKPAPMDKLMRVDKIMNSNSMKGLLSGGADDRHLAKKNTIDRQALLQATKNCPTTHKKNSSYKHMVSNNGQIIYKE